MVKSVASAAVFDRCWGTRWHGYRTGSTMIYLEESTVIHAPVQRCFDLARSVEVHLLSNVHSGEQALATGGITTGLVGLNGKVTWRAKHFGVWQNLTGRTTELRAPEFFQVTMRRGGTNLPGTQFASWIHEADSAVRLTS